MSLWMRFKKALAAWWERNVCGPAPDECDRLGD